jgi:heme-degrading monooxygenase HmoA
MNAGRVAVLLFAVEPDTVTEPDTGGGAVVDAYHRISRALAGTPGLLGNRLLAKVDRPGSFAILSEWESLAAFQTWERGPDHRQATAPLRPHQDRTLAPAFGAYVVSAEYTASGARIP